MQNVTMKFMAIWVGVVLIAVPTHAQTSNPYQLTCSISAGGVVSGGRYQVGVALGQPDAGEASGGGYTVGGGFFGGGQVVQPTPQPARRLTYLPLLWR